MKVIYAILLWHDKEIAITKTHTGEQLACIERQLWLCQKAFMHTLLGVLFNCPPCRQPSSSWACSSSSSLLRQRGALEGLGLEERTRWWHLEAALR